MIKETILNLITVLNRLDRESDTVIMIDWESRNIFLSQSLGNNIQCNEFWVLLNNLRDKGRTYDIISKAKLESLKYYLIRYANNSLSMNVLPEKYGFKIYHFDEILYKDSSSMIWSVECSFKFKTNVMLKLYLRLFNNYFRQLINSLQTIKFD